ncbi:hypothetical protein X798_00151 [Onchocerca flexuosa]|uniref:Uncharacterized protein n=1 Tax=Onchocerca flexuosa TaxID=387005 RepID=A0A238C661_9BILA|nr:hypothetical protein X798_00151 [Onchocerca flexuosa]
MLCILSGPAVDLLGDNYSNVKRERSNLPSLFDKQMDEVRRGEGDIARKGRFASGQEMGS